MPCVTYMDSFEFNSIYDAMDKELKEVSDEIFELSGKRFIVQCTEYYRYERKFIFWKNIKISKSYTVMVRIDDVEVQCINLLSGLGGGYTRNEAGAFLIGVLAGLYHNKGLKPLENNTNLKEGICCICQELLTSEHKCSPESIKTITKKIEEAIDKSSFYYGECPSCKESVQLILFPNQTELNTECSNCGHLAKWIKNHHDDKYHFEWSQVLYE